MAISVDVRPEQAGDHDQIRGVVARAFGSDVEPDLVERIRSSPEYRPATALVALVDGEVAGHVMISGAILLHDEVGRPIVMLSPLAVEPARQGQGIGSALVRAATELADESGEPLVVLEGSPTYYARFGFEFSMPLGIELPLPDWAPAEAGQVLRLQAYDSTWRGHVVYPPAFDGLE